eukprot:jgi/Antlo1/844/72
MAASISDRRRCSPLAERFSSQRDGDGLFECSSVMTRPEEEDVSPRPIFLAAG